MKKIYSGFFGLGNHVTWEFLPGHCTLPQNVEDGELCSVVKIGEYKDDEVYADIVVVVTQKGEKLTHQPNGTILHITRESKVPPVEAGLRATRLGWKVTDREPLGGMVAGYYEA